MSDKAMSLLSNLPDSSLLAELKLCCHSKNWARQMVCRRPYINQADLLSKAKDEWYRLEPSDWLEAFGAHPRIGDVSVLRSKFGSKEGDEQSGARSASETGKMSIHIELGIVLSDITVVYFTCTHSSAHKSNSFMLKITLNLDLQELQHFNDEYLAKFGFVFLICATGKSAKEMLTHLKIRVNNTYNVEVGFIINML
jgi:2-oxo-4-hydroxy-4-carboxy-5-ureidoimidazoline decarboxylase